MKELPCYFKKSSIPRTIWKRIKQTLTYSFPNFHSSRKLTNRNIPDWEYPSECVIVALSDTEDDYSFMCILEDSYGSNMMVPINLDDVQKESFKKMMMTGKLISNASTLKFSDGIIINNDKEIDVPKGLEVELGTQHRRRNLATAFGNKTLLVVKVTDAVGKARNETIDVMSDAIFGTFGNPKPLKSLFSSISFGKFNIVPATDLSVPNKGHIFNGVMEVTINITLEGNRDRVIVNAATKKVEEVLGLILPDPFDLVMILLEKCYFECNNYVGRAILNGWLSWFLFDFYKGKTAVHEIGVSFLIHLQICVAPVQNIPHSGNYPIVQYPHSTI